MSHYFKRVAAFAIATAFIFTSCEDNTASSREEVEIKTMDSTSKVIEENREKLEDQTEKVEKSLEKLDEEFDSTN